MVETGLVSVIIPNWNGKRFLPGCLDSLLKQSYPLLEIIVVDNGSTDGSVEFISTVYPSVVLIRFERNKGFSVAVNQGIHEAKGEFIALMNNDTVADCHWISEMVSVMNEHQEIASCGCKMLAYDNPKLLDGAGDGYRRGGLPGRIGHREVDAGQFDSQRYILGACGGAALYRKNLFDDIGLFDEDYFAYLEDVDLALRAQSAGYKCLYIPTAVIYHLGCGTTGSGYHSMVVRLSAQNNLNTIIKNIPTTLLLKYLWQILYWQMYYLAVVVVRGGQLIAWLEGTLRACLILPKMLKKRAEINSRRQVPLEYLEQMILQSERDLNASRVRLVAQETEYSRVKTNS